MYRVLKRDGKIADFDVKKDTDIIMDSGVAGNFEE